MRLSSLVPSFLKPALRGARGYLHGLRYRGTGRLCPVCGSASRRFAPFGAVPRGDALCVHCGALERHRLTWLFFRRRTDLFDRTSARMLHVAPEPTIETALRGRLGASYVTADLNDPKAMLKMDITDIQLPDESFDVIYCSHVLEHVPDDRRAMRELRRILKRDGWAVFQVPVEREATFEDPSVTDPKERARLFGQEDHVRLYGPDCADRLGEAGFRVTVTAPSDFLTREEIERMGITSAAGAIYYCTKI